MRVLLLFLSVSLFAVSAEAGARHVRVRMGKPKQIRIRGLTRCEPISGREFVAVSVVEDGVALFQGLTPGQSTQLCWLRDGTPKTIFVSVRPGW